MNTFSTSEWNYDIKEDIDKWQHIVVPGCDVPNLQTTEINENKNLHTHSKIIMWLTLKETANIKFENFFFCLVSLAIAFIQPMLVLVLDVFLVLRTKHNRRVFN